MRSPFVGRVRELARLGQLLDGATQGRGGLVVLGGEPGVGKTRLVREVAAEASGQGMVTLTGAAVEGDRSPYLPFLEIVEAAHRALPAERFLSALGSAAADLARLMPELRRWVPGLAAAVELPIEQERRLLFGAVTDLLGRLGPVLLVLEDLHWSDTATLQLLLHLARRLPGLPVVVVATYRDTELDGHDSLPATLDRLRREQLADQLVLTRFDRDETATLLAGLGASGRPPDPVRDAIHARTEGNAFFVEALYEHLAEAGVLLDRAGRWREPLVLDEVGVPAGVRLVIELRLRRLASRTRAVLTAMAVLGGQSVPCDLLVAMQGIGSELVVDALEDAERANLVSTAAVAGRAHAGFVHELVRQTLLDALSAPRREQHHLHAAATITTLYGERLDEHAADLVHHLLRAGEGADPGELYRWLLIAADRAVDVAAFEDALRHLDAASALGEDRDRVGLLGRKARALRGMGRWDEAITTWRDVLRVLEQLDDRLAIGRQCAEMAGDLLWAGRYEECVEAVRRGLAALGETVNGDRVRLLAFGGRFAGFRGDWAQAHRQTDEGLRVAEQLGEPGPLAVALFARTVHDWSWAEPTSAIRHATRAATAARTAGAHWDLAEGLGFAAFANVLAGDMVEVVRIVEKLDQLAARFGHHGAALVSGRNALLAQIAAADLDAVHESGLADLQLCTRVHLPFEADAHVWLGLVAFWRGDWDEAAKRYQLGTDLELPSAVIGGGWAFSFLLRAHRSQVESCRTMLAGAAAGFPGADRPALLGRWTSLLAATEGLAVLGRNEQAAAYYPVVEQALAAGNVLRAYDNRLVRAVAGLSAAAARRWDDAEAHFETALVQADSIPLLVEQPEVRRLYASMLLDRGGRGDRGLAVRLVDEAVTAYRRIGMPEHAAMARNLLDPTPASRPGHPDGLTPREAQVLGLIAAGATSKEVAAALFVSVATVYRHVANIYPKIGARNRAEATAYALRHGVGDTSPA